METPYSKEEIDALLEQGSIKTSPKFKEMAKEAILKIQGGALPKDALGFTPEMLNTIYSHAYNLFQSGQYKLAVSLFDILQKLDPIDYRYAFSIAACYQYQNRYEEALANYLICSELEPLNPLPSFHRFDCFMKMNDYFSAWIEIQLTIALAEKDPLYDEFKERVLLEYKGFKKELKTHFIEKFGMKEDVEIPDFVG